MPASGSKGGKAIDAPPKSTFASRLLAHEAVFELLHFPAIDRNWSDHRAVPLRWRKTFSICSSRGAGSEACSTDQSPAGGVQEGSAWLLVTFGLVAEMT